MPGIELRLELLPRKLAVIEFVPLVVKLSRSFSSARCVGMSNEPYKLSPSSGKWRRKCQKLLKCFKHQSSFEIDIIE